MILVNGGGNCRFNDIVKILIEFERNIAIFSKVLRRANQPVGAFPCQTAGQGVCAVRPAVVERQRRAISTPAGRKYFAMQYSPAFLVIIPNSRYTIITLAVVFLVCPASAIKLHAKLFRKRIAPDSGIN
ncbi:hypothetical protein [Paludibacterium sp. THUN1379]|uniref:hypothetical protein n=1 Tax=Paludibacterium sp. THUN1379 TaxID=3112107 RepID=UPI0030CADCE6